MEYRVLYRKYRPNDFDSLVGQDFTKTLLKNCIQNNKISHAYIFTGPRGTGKTSSAKIFSKAINCENPINGNPCNKCEKCLNFADNPDVIELDAASNNGVDEIREIINNVRLAPSISKYKVYIIDEFHMLSTSAFNALLLTLEEPPSNVVFILATTDIQSVPITVLSRCQRFDFKPIEVTDIVKRLRFVCSEESITITDDALHEIAYMANGGMRDALSILDQISSKTGEINVDDITANFGSVSLKKINIFIKEIDDGNIENVLNLLESFKHDGIDAKVLIEKLIEQLKQIIFSIKMNNYDGNLDFDDVYKMIFDLNYILTDMKSSINPYNFIEIVVIKYINLSIDTKTKNKINKIEDNENSDIKVISSFKNTLTDNKKDVEVTSGSSNEQNVDSFDISKRINNCFVNAKKTYLNDIKQKWDDFIIYEKNANKTLMSYIVDTDIVAASDKYAILNNDNDSTNELINSNIEGLENDFRIFYNLNCKLVSITPKRWDQEKQNYINNVKNGYKYSIIDENLVAHDDSELEKLATEIFGNNIEVN